MGSLFSSAWTIWGILDLGSALWVRGCLAWGGVFCSFCRVLLLFRFGSGWWPQDWGWGPAAGCRAVVPFCSCCWELKTCVPISAFIRFYFSYFVVACFFLMPPHILFSFDCCLNVMCSSFACCRVELLLAALFGGFLLVFGHFSSGLISRIFYALLICVDTLI
jgi:hypothetical protein